MNSAITTSELLYAHMHCETGHRALCLPITATTASHRTSQHTTAHSTAHASHTYMHLPLFQSASCVAVGNVRLARLEAAAAVLLTAGAGSAAGSLAAFLFARDMVIE